MILTSLTRALKTQNWLAVGIEFVIVIAGVVIGFQVTAWNADREDRAREAVIIDRLSEEFAVILETSEARTELAQSTVRSTRELIERLASQNWPAEFDQLITLVDRTRSFPGPLEAPTSFNELISTGDMSLIQDDGLRRALTDFATIRGDHVRGLQLSREVALHLGGVFWDFSELAAAADYTDDPALRTRALEDIRRHELIAPLAAIHRQQLEVANQQAAMLEAVQAVVIALEDSSP